MTRALLWFLLALALVTRAYAQAPRIAIVSDAASQDLAALVTTEISSNPSVSLVERDDLAKIGDEAKLQQMAGSDATALGKLLGADGLVFLDRRSDGLHVRLTAVNLGYALFDDVVPGTADSTVAAKVLVHLVADDAPKLKLTPKRAIPLSVLNLRADASTVDAASLDRDLSLLLESRLAAVPEYVLLERRHADALGFERTLSEPGPSALLHGAYLIDGSFQVAPGSDGFTVSIRIRSAKLGQEITFQVPGSRKELASTVEIISQKIAEKIDAPVSAAKWSPTQEAREYLREGIWGWEHHEPATALEALDSAELLGESAPDLLAIRVHVLCELASQEPYFYGGKELPVPSRTLQERLDDLHRAMADFNAYKAGKGESALLFFKSNLDPDVRGGELNDTIVHQGLALLKDDEDARAPAAENLRQELRAWCGFDPARGRAPALDEPDPLCESADEEVLYFRALLHGNGKWLPWQIHPEDFCNRFYAMPEERKKAYDKFVQQLVQDPQDRLFGLLLLSGDLNPEVRDKAYPQFVDEFWARRDELMVAHRFPAYASRASNLPDDIRKKYTNRTVPLLRYFLSKVGNLDADNNGYVLHYLWQPAWFSEEDARAIWADYQAARVREAAFEPKNGDDHAHVESDSYAAAFLQQFPQLGQTVARSDERTPLTVDKYWQPSNTAGEPYRGFHQFDMIPSSDGVWVLGGEDGLLASTGIYQVRLPDLATAFLATDCGGRPYNVVKTSDAIYVTYGEYPPGGGPIQTFLKRYDLVARKWETRQIDDITAGSLYCVNDQLYFDLWTVVGRLEEGGLARYDWAKDHTTILASSRRRPPQNQFDDRAGYQIHGLFAGPGNRLCVNADGGIYYVCDQPGPWPAVYDFASFVQPETQGCQTLVRSAGGEVMLLDAGQPGPVPLMVPAEPRDWRRQADHTLKKALPSWAAQARWKASLQWGWANIFGNPRYLGYHDGHLFALASPNEQYPRFQLLWFITGRPDPVAIPLRFLIDSSEEKAITQGMVFPPKLGSSNSTLIMLPTDQGICFHELRGFWFLPYKQIDHYLKSVSG
jgi:hypothetical protein